MLLFLKLVNGNNSYLKIEEIYRLVLEKLIILKVI